MRLRRLPPVAAPSTVKNLLAGLAGVRHPEAALQGLSEDLRRTMGVQHVFLLSSGRAALTLILRALARTSPRRRVVVPAYTCFSVAAAVVRAGLELVPCDIDPATLDFDYAQLEQLLQTAPPLCVVSAHLFGLPADTERVARLCQPRGIAVVEDAAQAFAIRRADGWLGTRGDVGFFSFGRGKTVSACGGGAIVTNSPALGSAIAAECAKAEAPSAVDAATSVAKAAALSVLVRPHFYWLPARLPFLGIGETHYSTDFALQRMNGGQAGLLRSWSERSADMNEARRNNMARYDAHARTMASEEDVAMLRLPFLCRSRAERDRLAEAGKRAGLGVVPMYPSALNAIPELEAQLGSRRYPGAEAVAERLVTLPVHPLVSPGEIAAISRLVDEIASGASVLPGQLTKPLGEPGDEHEAA